MRTQPTRIRTGTMKKRLVWGICLLLLGLLAVACWYLTVYGWPYSPPPFESTAVLGVPEPPENMGYGKIEAEGGFTFSMAGTMYQQEDGSLLLYMTNHDISDIWIMCDIVDENDVTLYKSGVVRQGEYVERLYPQREIPNEAIKVEVKVYGFEPETYYSRGSVFLSNILQPW